MSASTKLFFSDFTHFAKVKTPEISQNVLIAKVSICQKMSKLSKINKKGNKLLRINKFPLQKLLILYLSTKVKVRCINYLEGIF